MSPASQLMEQLAAKFRPWDEKVLAADLAWAKSRCEAVANVKAVANAARASGEKREDVYNYYKKLFEAAGGKSFYDLFQYGFGDRAKDFMTKNCAAKVSARNAKIAKKLVDANILSIDGDGESIAYTRDGFDGVWRCNDGAVIITVNTIIAGGYNIQRAHYRVLVKVKC